MHIDRYEAAFLWLGTAMMLLFAGAVIISVFGLNINLPGNSGQLAPADVYSEPGFASPGLREIDEGRYEAYIVATHPIFTPSALEIPAGSEVTFFVASTDVTHGFKVFDTNVNMMVIPGQISQFTYTFDEPGEYRFYCLEYCGAAHHTMTGMITVTGN